MLVLERGSNGVDVLGLQRRLKELGDYEGRLDGDYGPLTEAAVKQFEARAGLTIDGKADELVLARLFPNRKLPEMPTIAELPMFHYRMLVAARGQVGVREDGYNRGPMVEKYLASVGLKPGNPYCLAGLYWCGQRAAEMAGEENPMLRTGHCETFFKWAKSRGYVLSSPKKARLGDIGIMLFGEGKGHAFIIDQLGQGNWQTIEFNTNGAGSREGDGVMRRTRRWTEVAGVVRLPEAKELKL